ncbi:MAG: bile acid:sodium symporter [Thermoguttaceae bacterium]|nr:bile acid:sodium symporter [Thermoguttaceae bacterium]
MNNLLKRFGLSGFIFSLGLAVLAAWIYPPPGVYQGLFSFNTVAQYGVSVIFFFYGLRLDRRKIQEGLSNYRLHLIVHSSTFILFPLIILLIMSLFHQLPTREQLSGTFSSSETSQQVSGYWLWLGIFFLATLPSTVSSSVVMVNLARGNVPAAIFNASISSIIGIFITPLWMRLFINTGNGGQSLNQVIFSLIIQVILPVGLGIFSHRWWGTFSQTHDKLLRYFDQSIIVTIVYTSFCHSFKEEMFSGVSTGTLIFLFTGMIALFFCVYFLIGMVCLLLRFNREDRITALFCGSKKSLVHGTVMSQVILADPRLAGVLILPTMIYHALQLVIVSVLAQSMRHQKEKNRQKPRLAE